MTESSIPGYTTQILTGQQAKETDPLRDSDNSGTSVSNPYNARIGVLRELHSRKSDRSCIHVELDIQGSGIQYEAGDHVGLLCENGPGIIEEAGRILGIPLDTIFSLQLPEGNPHELALPFTGTAPVARCLHVYAWRSYALHDRMSVTTELCGLQVCRKCSRKYMQLVLFRGFVCSSRCIFHISLHRLLLHDLQACSLARSAKS